MGVDMTKLNKAFSIRQYIEANPNAKPTEVASQTGTHLAYVYAIQQKMRARAKKKAASASAPSKGQEVLRDVISKEEETIANLRFDLALQLDAAKAYENEIQRLCNIITYLEKFVCTAERVGKL